MTEDEGAKWLAEQIEAFGEAALVSAVGTNRFGWDNDQRRLIERWASERSRQGSRDRRWTGWIVAIRTVALVVIGLLTLIVAIRKP